MGYTYAYTSLRLQSAQLGQLHALNQQMWLQQADEHRQRYLSDVLLSATQAADRIMRTQRQDPFAAAILATRWMQTLSWVNAALFSDFQRKQTWEHSRAAFATARDSFYANAQASALATTYMQIEDRELFLFGVLGQSPDTVLVTADQAMRVALSARQTRWILLAVLGGIGLVISIILGVAAQSGVLAVVFITMTAITVGGLAMGIVPGAMRNAANATRHHHHITSCLQEWRTLLASDPGLPLLTRLRNEHPLLLQPPAVDASSPASSAHEIGRVRPTSD